jgi:hypothetical protein
MSSSIRVIKSHHSFKGFLKILVIVLSSFIWIALFRISYSLRLRRRLEFSWVIGPNEIGDYAQRISTYIPKSKLVIMKQNPYSSAFQSSQKPDANGISSRIFELITRPKNVSELIASQSSFLYIGSNCYLCDCFCLRSLEYKLIKMRGGRVACFFLGSEIRSPQLVDSLSLEMKQDLSTTYLFDGPTGSEAKKLMQERADFLADSADSFANVIFNSPVDQISSITREVAGLFYYLPKSPTVSLETKSRFKSERVRIVHAPTSTVGKGTPIVRSVIKGLVSEGFDFDYVELTKVKNIEVIEELKRADIVLNEFYSFLPGILGIEAMYFKCALLTSADPELETWLPQGASHAWLRTRYWEIDLNLRNLLSNPDLISKYAIKGYEWVTENYTDAKNADYLNGVLDSS